MTVLVDTSVWVDFLRHAGSPAATRLRDLVLTDRDQVHHCGPVAMELLAGVTRPDAVTQTSSLVGSFDSLEFDPRLDFARAALIQRAARSEGRPVRSLVDCLIAAVALRHDAVLLHKDHDYEVIADLTGLTHESLR